MVNGYLKILTSAAGAMTFTFASLVAAANPAASVAQAQVAGSHIRG